MARIRLRPHDLALLAQRYDAAAEELQRSARRLERELDEVGLNPVDDEFPVGRFRDRSAVARARFRHLADEMGVDGSLLASAAFGGEYSNDLQWLQPLQVLASGWGSVLSLGSACSDVARGMAAIVGAMVTPARPDDETMALGDTGLGDSFRADAEADDRVTKPESNVMVDDSMAGQNGGLFVTVFAGGNGDVAYLGGLLGRVARQAGESETSRAEPDWAHIWTRVHDDLDANTD